MKNMIRNKGFMSLFMALMFTLTTVLSTSLPMLNNVYAAEYPQAPEKTEVYFSALEKELEAWPGADINWYLSNPDAEQFSVSTPAELFGMAFLV